MFIIEAISILRNDLHDFPKTLCFLRSPKMRHMNISSVQISETVLHEPLRTLAVKNKKSVCLSKALVVS